MDKANAVLVWIIRSKNALEGFACVAFLDTCDPFGCTGGYYFTAAGAAFAAIPVITEFDIGHNIISRSVFVGLNQAVREMIDEIG